MEREYLFMFTALEEWHICPWLDPITHLEYPEVKYSMFRLLNYKVERIRHDNKKAEAEARMKHR